MRHASVEARPHAARGTSSAETHRGGGGRSFVLVAVPAEMHCLHAILARGLRLAVRCLFPCVIMPGKLALDLLGFAWQICPHIFANCLELSKSLSG